LVIGGQISILERIKQNIKINILNHILILNIDLQQFTNREQMHLDILVANEGDLEAILNLQKECYQTEAELHNEYNIPPLTQTIEEIKKEMEQGTLFLKGMINGQLIGSVRGNSNKETTFIGRLIVDSQFQNQKIGQTLMKEIETQLNDCNRYELFTGFKSEKNLKLYQKLGYREFKRQLVNQNLTLVYLEKIR
jgi:predicted N-acetyltransferase YhbS